MTDRMKVTIPHCYVWMTAGYPNRGAMFKSYLAGYVEHTHPGWYLVKIEGMKAICERRFD
ncbi:hypothetical protein SAMN05421743_105195 [Thalassobacillus cyri]|uniref:Transposase n=1 Tax=Thalassobacillus cyri TaxID=571932 RepID=A0A1H4BYK8_9BACI|nr:hypothetical protein [Thalassobacillus cyri]SEA53163.1 hypothetical protein SAMN05421743_105195 [Thalassobacillus cyri]